MRDEMMCCLSTYEYQMAALRLEICMHKCIMLIFMLCSAGDARGSG